MEINVFKVSSKFSKVKYTSDYVKNSHDSDTRICKVCGKEHPLNSHYFKKGITITARGERKAYYLYTCKTCMYESKGKNKKGDLYRCHICGEYLPADNFDINSKNYHRDGLDRRCKKCKAIAFKKRKEQRYKSDPFRRMLVERLAGAKERAKKNNLDIDIDIEYLKFLWNAQKGKCAISDIKMTYVMLQGRVSTNLSIDRIDTNVGYIRGNVQLVCSAVNAMKSDLSKDELLYFCENILNNAKNARSWSKKK